jgi:Mn2+/Fe2+ NRAMP family transporter
MAHVTAPHALGSRLSLAFLVAAVSAGLATVVALTLKEVPMRGHAPRSQQAPLAAAESLAAGD